MDVDTEATAHQNDHAPDRKYTGSCFCGAVEVEATGEPTEMGYCHCRSCRSYSGGPLSSFVLWRADRVTVTKGLELLVGFNKTGKSDRQHCGTCGGHVMTKHPGFGFTDMSPAMLPTLSFRPTVHLNYSESILPIRDGLPKFKDFPAWSGGSGQVLPE
jgi:hypothetical protein